MFMLLGLKGVLNCIRNQHDSIFLVAFIGYLVVGSGSFLFHSTLKCKPTSNAMHDFPLLIADTIFGMLFFFFFF